MPLSSRKYCGGFTYLAALFMIMIMGIMLGMVGQSWSALMKREREEELFFRGSQIKDAITSWYTPRSGQHAATPLRELKDLLKDPRSLTTIRYLRQIYTDPVTGKEWEVISGPVKGKPFVGVIGVKSKSDAAPLKQAGFPEEYITFEGKTKYSEWEFVYGQTQLQGSLKVQMPKSPLLQ
ncbi:hypothetical protein OR1_02807 [Geobacter sp. OR-1]|uniref:type II secretion system protein n=1 Tax=Geobacter sp. OR-1 TaxID=1266765 RepID=UPI000541E43F|nr:type II secretion system protein [Geobacter sp. OR-1]GAM10518.1 hypothetical protein OR1_02807 [Geobacter sp. OR-1]